MSRIFKAFSVLMILSAVFAAQNRDKKRPIEGVWKIVEVASTRSDKPNTTPQPSQLIFTQGHYSLLVALGNEPRAQTKSETATDAEKIASFDSLLASSGTYEISGSTLTFLPIVSKNPNYMGGGFTKYQFRIEGSNLWLTEHTSDTSFRFGDQIVASKAPEYLTTTKFVRVE